MRITKYSSVAACLFCLGGAVPCGQSFIYVSGWGNKGIRGITTLKLAGSSLSVVFNTDECGFTPTWLQPANNILYCTNEGWSESSTLTSFAVNSDGSLSKLHQVLTQLGPVHSVVYGGGSRLAVPY
jgi:3-carboxy-cis,cis-muconate lactonizing enzyme.